MNSQKSNPLAGFFRQARHHIPLPSGGRWYPAGSLEWPASGELAILPMTAKDEIALKTPDALLNGQSTVDVIESCVPAIKNAWMVPSVDLDTLLIAIRIASYGPNMEINPACPSCKTVNNFQADLKDAVTKNLGSEWLDVLKIDDLRISLRPLTYQQLTNKQRKTFEEQRLIEELQRSDIDNNTKVEKFNQGMAKLRELTIEIVLDSIEYVELPNGVRVEEREYIQEFLQNSSRSLFETINLQVKKNKENFSLPPLFVKCENCEHEWKQSLEFDASNFFAESS
jgi:hypothetical protein